mgnify:CR=1 FL=1
MTLTEKIFGKDSSELSISYFKEYFVKPKDESNLIEYKSYYDKYQNNHKFKAKEIVKNICAFLNSEGGLLIWGAPVESKTADGRKFYKGELSLISEFIDKDSFYSKILNSIVPLPTGVTLEILDDKKSGKQLVLFEVKESMTKPHRYDSRYYLRLDGQTLIAPHHYLKALFNQIQIPKVECYVKFDSYKYEEFKSISGYQKGGNFYCLRIELWIFNFSRYNNEENLKYRLNKY